MRLPAAAALGAGVLAAGEGDDESDARCDPHRQPHPLPHSASSLSPSLPAPTSSTPPPPRPDAHMGAATGESEAPEPLHLVRRRCPLRARAAPARDGRGRGPVGDESRASAYGSDGALRWVGREHAELQRLLGHGGDWIQREGPCEPRVGGRDDQRWCGLTRWREVELATRRMGNGGQGISRWGVKWWA